VHLRSFLKKLEKNRLLLRALFERDLPVEKTEKAQHAKLAQNVLGRCSNDVKHEPASVLCRYAGALGPFSQKHNVRFKIRVVVAGKGASGAARGGVVGESVGGIGEIMEEGGGGLGAGMRIEQNRGYILQAHRKAVMAASSTRMTPNFSPAHFNASTVAWPSHFPPAGAAYVSNIAMTMGGS
jgi:hypothetical protein